MMKTNWWVGALACALLACSSAAEQGGPRCPNGQCAGLGMDALPSTETPDVPSGSPAFDNADQPSTPPPPPAVDDPTAMAGMGSDGDCEAGVFCDPRGPDEGCGAITFESEVEVTRHPGNVLLVFDRSASMGEDWNGQQRWQSAGAAVESALEPLVADIAMAGTVFFPTENPDSMPVCVDPTGITCIFVPGLMFDASGASCLVASDDASHIDFLPGADFLPAFSTGDAGGAPPYFPVQGGFTPLKEGLQEAQRILSEATLEGQTAVVVITDGEPNCEWDAAVATGIVTEWYDQGINTHVIGLPGMGGGFGGGGGNGTALLNQLATAGGTDQFVTPADPDALAMQLRTIVSETVKTGFNSCSIDLTPPADVPEKLLMIVEEAGVDKKQQVPRDFGWELSAAGDRVEMTGNLCEEAMAGRFSAITFEYGCPDVEPPPPIPPLQ